MSRDLPLLGAGVLAIEIAAPYGILCHMWKKLSSKIVFSNPWLELWEDQVQLPNGETTTYIKTTPGLRGVTVIAINKDKKILLQDEYSYPIGHRMLEFPGGGAEKEETIEAAAKRELLEETGFSCGEIENLGWYYSANRKSDFKMYVVLARDLHWKGTQHEASENPITKWYSLEEADALITSAKIPNWSVLAGWTLVRPKLFF
jgi:8-oxo-dGTP pyrophosphatase MutT (NUDIX family)